MVSCRFFYSQRLIMLHMVYQTKGELEKATEGRPTSMEMLASDNAGCLTLPGSTGERGS